MLKLGSLFDGSGGFPLAGVLHGIVPVWASEIEPYPMRVTALRFPNMKREREDKRYMVNGNMVSIAEMSALSNQPYMRVYQRIKRLGWTPERAMQ